VKKESTAKKKKAGNSAAGKTPERLTKKKGWQGT